MYGMAWTAKPGFGVAIKIEDLRHQEHRGLPACGQGPHILTSVCLISRASLILLRGQFQVHFCIFRVGALLPLELLKLPSHLSLLGFITRAHLCQLSDDGSAVEVSTKQLNEVLVRGELQQHAGKGKVLKVHPRFSQNLGYRQPTSCFNPVRRSCAGLAVDGPSVTDVEDPVEDLKCWCVVDFGTLN